MVEELVIITQIIMSYLGFTNKLVIASTIKMKGQILP